jgi:hypothetical protein
MTDIKTLEQALKRIRVAQVTHTALPYNFVCEEIESFITEYKRQVHVDKEQNIICHECGFTDELNSWEALEAKNDGQ